MKDKIGQPRTYDEEGFRQRAACICFKDKNEEEVIMCFILFFLFVWGRGSLFYIVHAIL